MRRLIDPRQARLGQAITGGGLLAGYLASWEPVLPLAAVVLGAAALGGPALNPYAHLFRLLRPRIGPPRFLEEAGPPRFANAVGFAFLAAATTLWVSGQHGAAWILALVVSSLALLAAITGLCVGCELYVLSRGLLGGDGTILRERQGT